MKQTLFILLMAIVALSPVTAAADSLYADDFTISAGETKRVDLKLDNETVYCAFQTDIMLPDWLLIETDEGEYIIDPTSRYDGHIVSSNKLSSGAIRVFVTSSKSMPFSGSSGPIAIIQLVAGPEVASGSLKLTNTVLVEVDGTKHDLPDTKANINGRDNPMDVNDDGRVDVGDVNAVLTMILAGDSDPIGNVNGDATVDVGDVNAILAAILTQ